MPFGLFSVSIPQVKPPWLLHLKTRGGNCPASSTAITYFYDTARRLI